MRPLVPAMGVSRNTVTSSRAGGAMVIGTRDPRVEEGGTRRAEVGNRTGQAGRRVWQDIHPHSRSVLFHTILRQVVRDGRVGGEWCPLLGGEVGMLRQVSRPLIEVGPVL